MSNDKQAIDAPDHDVERDDAVIGRAFRWSALAIAIVAAAVGGGIWWLNRPKGEEEAVAVEQTRAEVRENQNNLPTVTFVDVTDEAGIDFSLENGAAGEVLLPETMCGGMAFFDCDQDGDSDILFVNGNHWPWSKPTEGQVPTLALYRNDGRGHFDNITAGSGLEVSMYGQGAAVGDYDNDGRVDVFVSAVGACRLFHNEGGGKFRDATAETGVAGDPEAWSTSSAFIDHDNDGDLDLFVCRYLVWSRALDRATPCTIDGKIRAYCRPMDFGGTFPVLYRNDDGTFVDVSAAAGIQVKNAATDFPAGKSLGVAPIDVDNDGWIDLVVANDTVRNFLFHNQRNGTFDEIGERVAIAFGPDGGARGAMGCDAGYIRNDSTLAIVIGNFANEPSALYAAKIVEGRPPNFTDISNATGLAGPSRSRLKFGTFLFDYDLDGLLDVFTANGHLEPEISKVQLTQQYEQPPHLFCNCGRKSRPEFALVPNEKCGADFSRPIVGRGAGYADIDGDGDLDVLVTAVRGKPRLLRNDQTLSRHYLRARLTGTRANRDAIGAWVEAHIGDRVLKRQVMPARSYLSQVELPVTFGLDQATKVDKLVVRWPGGGVQELLNVPADQTIAIEQSTAN